MEHRLIRLCDAPQLKNSAAEWFSEKWNIPLQAYLDSMEECISGSTVPQWYMAFCGERIVGGLGVIENDFHERPDLAPNVCAVYTEKDFRGRGIAGELLGFACSDMSRRGIESLYLLTDHDSFYERYGWQFLCMVHGTGEAEPSRMYIHKST